MFTLRYLSLLLSGLIFFTCQTPRTSNETLSFPDSIDETSDGWISISPGGKTGCATGTPFIFHVKPGKKNKVVVFLNGGGACWSAELCALDIEPVTYQPFATDESNDPRGQKGIFDLEHPDNLVRDWTIVYVPYCTGDVHLGATEREYVTSDGKKVVIQHLGQENVKSALDWLYSKIDNPEVLLMTGVSAGALAVPYYAMEVATAYPKAEIISFGDGAGGYRSNRVGELITAWGVTEGKSEYKDELRNFESLYSMAQKKFPRIKFAQVNAAYDQVQMDFLRLMGIDQPLYPLLKANLEELEEGLANFTNFVLPGHEHTVLQHDRFYTLAVGGKTLVSWTNELLDGKNPESVYCENNGGCQP
jgi:hypothetical protein